jgi:hypothetical protein
VRPWQRQVASECIVLPCSLCVCALLAEARLLESERRSMRMRVSDQIESERRAALAAGRRRNEQEVSTKLAGEQSASLEHQQAST